MLIVKNKEFGTLFIIMLFTIGQYYQNRGQFRLHLEKIDRVDEKATEAKRESKEAIEAIQEMKPKVDEMHKGFTDYMDDKYKKYRVLENGE